MPPYRGVLPQPGRRGGAGAAPLATPRGRRSAEPGGAFGGARSFPRRAVCRRASRPVSVAAGTVKDGITMDERRAEHSAGEPEPAVPEHGEAVPPPARDAVLPDG